MDLQCILCITNSSYAVQTPKDKVTCNTYWEFYKKIENLDMFPSKRESPVQNRGVGTYGLYYRMY